jgi:hypothetical protein
MIALVALMLLPAPVAGAAYDPIGSDATKLVLDQRFARFLAGDGIEVRAAAGARRSGLRSDAQPQLATILPSDRATLVLDGA